MTNPSEDDICENDEDDKKEEDEERKKGSCEQIFIYLLFSFYLLFIGRG